MSYEQLGVIVRLASALVWTALFIWFLRQGQSGTGFRRVLSTGSVVLLLWALVIGGLATVGAIPFEVGRYTYTAVATALLITGITLFSMRDQ